MRTVTINDTKVSIPQKWNELTKDQFIYICSLFFQPGEFHSKRFLLMAYLLGLKIKNMGRLRQTGEAHAFIFNKKTIFIEPDDLAGLLDATNFLFKKTSKNNDPETYQVSSNLTVNLIPSFIVNNTEFHGPADMLSNITYAEYIHTETNFFRYYKHQAPVFLDRLIAILYRPKSKSYNPKSIDYNGDIREPFNDFLTDDYAIQIKGLDPAIKSAILLFYEGCKWFIGKKFPLMHDGDRGNVPDDIFMINMEIVNALADYDVTKVDKVRKQLLYDVLTTQESMIKRNKAMEEETKKIKNNV